jgi:hypothetical protein
MGIKITSNGPVRVMALLLAVAIPGFALWSWIPDSSREWLAVIAVVGVFWVAWEACVPPPANEDSTEI